MIVLVDTNVLVSAALRNRLPEQVVRYIATNGECRWIVTAEILTEYVEVLRRPRFGLSSEIINQWTELLNLRTTLVTCPAGPATFARDPKDVPFLAAAVAAGADFLITGDNDLLQAKGVVPTRIMTVVEFAAEIHIA
jgi:uncharacterized protein